jgi:hypothetical protein
MQFSSYFQSSRKSLFSNDKKDLSVEIDDEYDNICPAHSLASPTLSRDEDSFSFSFSPLARGIPTRSRNNSLVGSLFPTPSSRPVSGRFNLNSIFSEVPVHVISSPCLFFVS